MTETDLRIWVNYWKDRALRAESKVQEQDGWLRQVQERLAALDERVEP